MSINNEVKKYVKNIKKRLLYNTKESIQYLKNLEINIMEYIDEFQVTDITAIKCHFGSEEEIAKAYFETIDMKNIKRKINIKRIIAVFVAAIIIIWSIGAIITTIQANLATGSYSVHYEIEEEISLSNTTRSI